MDIHDDRSTTVDPSAPVYYGLNNPVRDTDTINHKISQLEYAIEMQMRTSKEILEKLHDLRKIATGGKNTVGTPHTLDRPSFSESERSSNFRNRDDDGPASGPRYPARLQRRRKRNVLGMSPRMENEFQDEPISVIRRGKMPKRNGVAPSVTLPEQDPAMGLFDDDPSEIPYTPGPAKTAKKAPNVPLSNARQSNRRADTNGENYDRSSDMGPPPRPNDHGLTGIPASVETDNEDMDDDDTDELRPVSVQASESGDEDEDDDAAERRDDPHNPMVFDDTEEDMDYEPSTRSPAPSLPGPSTQSVRESLDGILTPVMIPPRRKAPTSMATTTDASNAVDIATGAATGHAPAPVARMGGGGDGGGGAVRARRGGNRVGAGRGRKSNPANRLLAETPEWERDDWEGPEAYAARRQKAAAQMGSTTRGPKSVFAVAAAAREPPNGAIAGPSAAPQTLGMPNARREGGRVVEVMEGGEGPSKRKRETEQGGHQTKRR